MVIYFAASKAEDSGLGICFCLTLAGQRLRMNASVSDPSLAGLRLRTGIC